MAALAQQTAPDEFFDAVRKGDAAAVAGYLDKGVAIESEWRYGTTALFIAASRGHADVVKLLLDRGAKANVKDTFYGMTALAAAANGGKADVVRLLLAKGAEGRGQAVIAAVTQNNVELLKASLDSSLPKSVLNNAWLRASVGGKKEIAALLKEAGAEEVPLPVATIAPEVLQSYAGRYRGEQGDIVLAVKEGMLHASYGPQNFVLRPFDTRTFMVGENPSMKVLMQAADGGVKGFVLESGSSKQEYKKVDP